MNEVLPQGPRSETKEQEGPQGGDTPCGRPHPHEGPKKWLLSIHVIPKIFAAKPQKVAFHKVTIKLIFTIHDDIFQRLIELKIFMWA